MWILGLRESKWNSSVCPVDLKPYLFCHFYEIMFFSLVTFHSNSVRFGIKAVFYTCFNLLGLVSRETFLRYALRATCFNNEGDYTYGDLQFKCLLKLHFKVEVFKVAWLLARANFSPLRFITRDNPLEY